MYASSPFYTNHRIRRDGEIDRVKKKKCFVQFVFPKITRWALSVDFFYCTVPVLVYEVKNL